MLCSGHGGPPPDAATRSASTHQAHRGRPDRQDRSMRTILLVHPSLEPPGGGSAVGAWLLQALQSRYRVTVVTWAPVDFSAVNRAYGTTLDPSSCRILTVPAAQRRLLHLIPRQLVMLRSSLVARAARRALAEERYDLVVGAMNELDVGRHVVQYVHFPLGKFPRPGAAYQ